MRFLIANLTVFCLISVAHADDGWVEVTGGSACLIQEHPTISMADEYVLIEMMPDKYKVTAAFNFYNAGESTSVAVGFPVSGNAEYKKSSFISFKTWVNGHRVATTNYQDSATGDELEYSYYKVKKVQFLGKSTTTSVVEYEAPYGHSVGPVQWVAYNYSTGRSWKGPIGKVVIDLRFQEGLLGLHPVDDSLKLSHRAKGQMIFEASNLKPEAPNRFYVDFNPMEQCLTQAVRKHESVNAYCSSIAGWIGKPSQEKDLLGDSAKQPTLGVLRLRRNALYAKYGRVFKDQQLSNFFSNMNWYSPRPYFKESDLTESDRESVADISRLEKSIESAKVFPIPFSIPRD